MKIAYPDNSPCRRTIPHRTGFGPDELNGLFRGSGPSGELSWWGIVLGIHGPGGQWLGFIFIWWGIVLMGSCPRTEK